MAATGDTAEDRLGIDEAPTVFRAFEPDEFLAWPAWQRLERILRSNGGSYGLSGPRGAGKSWLMLRAIQWAQTPRRRGGRAGLGLWYPSPSEYDPLAFLASLSDSLAIEVERWYRRDPLIRALGALGAVLTAAAAVIAFLVAREAEPAGERSVAIDILVALACAAPAALLVWLLGRLVLSALPHARLLREARFVRERARFSATRREASELGAEGGRGLVGRGKITRERELVDRPATLSSLVMDFRGLAAEAGAVTGRVVIAIDELDKMANPEKVRALLRDIKGIFEVPHVHFLVSVSDEAARNLSLGALTERNEFNSSFYTVVRAQPAKPEDCADLLQQRANVPREVSLVVAVLAGGNPRELLRLAESAGSAATAEEAAMQALRDEAVTLRGEVVAATVMEGVPDLDQDAREGAFLSLTDSAFEKTDEFVALCDDALDGLWHPSWADPGWSVRFEEPWRRLMVRLAVARQLTASQSLLRDRELINRLRDVVVVASQSSHVARIVLERELRVETLLPAVDDSLVQVRQELDVLARRYENTRRSMRSGRDRTRAMDQIALEARRLSRDAGLTGDEIIESLRSERPGDRVIGLAAVQATADPSTFSAVFDAVRSHVIPFEQFHALSALESLRPGLTPEARTQVVELLQDEKWRKALGGDGSRLKLADRILAALRSGS